MKNADNSLMRGLQRSSIRTTMHKVQQYKVCTWVTVSSSTYGACSLLAEADKFALLIPH